jgi:hypothetical protein
MSIIAAQSYLRRARPVGRLVGRSVSRELYGPVLGGAVPSPEVVLPVSPDPGSPGLPLPKVVVGGGGVPVVPVVVPVVVVPVLVVVGGGAGSVVVGVGPDVVVGAITGATIGVGTFAVGNVVVLDCVVVVGASTVGSVWVCVRPGAAAGLGVAVAVVVVVVLVVTVVLAAGFTFVDAISVGCWEVAFLGATAD